MATPEVGIVQTTNRRRDLRTPVKPLVYLTKTTDNPGFLLNLSEKGMAIQAMDILQQGWRIEFQFSLPKTKVEISGSADVVWCDPTGRAGLKFASLSEFDRSHLHRWITETQIN
jgi:c-di-GMP-binding flagellar brake protein YcgR